MFRIIIRKYKNTKSIFSISPRSVLFLLQIEIILLYGLDLVKMYFSGIVGKALKVSSKKRDYPAKQHFQNITVARDFMEIKLE